ncbi:MAG: PEGA domain-containing protein, partial [Candidatus Delongbacteria bacterium]|nr:PEGA domain-containing protein [Candidatus Delongbacteria bacterium]
DWCALLKVFTDIKDIQFKGNGYEKHDYRDGIYYVYMFNGSKNLTFIKDGYTTKPHNFPISLKSNVVYGIEIKGVGEEKKIEDIAITIQTEPKGATIYIDGENKGTSEQVKTSVGKHELKLEKSGHETKTATIEVTAEKTLFKYNLNKIQDALVEINSNPEGAKVYIDDKLFGTTPAPGFFPPGNYSIRLSSDNFEDINETIQIKTPETKKIYQLTDIRATLTINTHDKAKVYINGEQVTNYRNIKLPPQVATVKVEMNKAKTLEERVMLSKKENKTIDMYPEIATGTVQVAVIPSDANVELWEDGGEKYTSTGSRIFEDVPVGNYKMKILKNGYDTQEFNLKLNEGIIEKRSIKLVHIAETSWIIADEIELYERDKVSYSFYFNGKARFSINGKTQEVKVGDMLPVGNYIEKELDPSTNAFTGNSRIGKEYSNKIISITERVVYIDYSKDEVIRFRPGSDAVFFARNLTDFPDESESRSDTETPGRRIPRPGK